MIWGVVLTLGFRALIEFETTAGAPGEVRATWPADAPVAFEASKSNLVMFAHPKCPCSQASLAELVKVLTRTKGALQASILFYAPAEATDEWKQADLWREAEEVPGLQVVADPGGVWAERFGAVTSGHVVLFDRGGRAVFRGGITGARGHEGDNAGEASVVALALAQTGTPAPATAIFGCPILNPSDRNP
jgi:hypothetical protein